MHCLLCLNLLRLQVQDLENNAMYTQSCETVLITLKCLVSEVKSCDLSALYLIKSIKQVLFNIYTNGNLKKNKKLVPKATGGNKQYSFGSPAFTQVQFSQVQFSSLTIRS